MTNQNEKIGEIVQAYSENIQTRADIRNDLQTFGESLAQLGYALRRTPPNVASLENGLKVGNNPQAPIIPYDAVQQIRDLIELLGGTLKEKSSLEQSLRDLDLASVIRS